MVAEDLQHGWSFSSATVRGKREAGSGKPTIQVMIGKREYHAANVVVVPRGRP
jgi:hypothetical protein